MYPAVLLIYFISAAVILLASLALIVQVSLPCNKTGRASYCIIVALPVLLYSSETWTIKARDMPIQRLKVAILPLDLPCSGLLTHSGEILTTGKSHGKKPDRFSLHNDTDVKKVSRFKYATWNIRGLGEKEELDKTLNENNIKIPVIKESKKKLQGTKETKHYTVIYSGVDRQLVMEHNNAEINLFMQS